MGRVNESIGRRARLGWACAVLMVVAAAVAPGAVAGGPGGTLTDQAVSLVFPPSHWSGSPAIDLLGTEAVPGTDVVYRSGWWYRVDGDTREYPFPAPDSETYVGGSLVALWSNVDGRGFEAREEVELFDLEGPSGAYTSRISLRTPAGPSVGVTLFHFVDPDVAGVGPGDSAMLVAPGFLRFTDGASTLRYRAERPEHFLVRPYASSVETVLNDLNVSAFDDSGLPFGPGDVTAGSQFKRLVTVASSGTWYIAATVEVASRPANALPKCTYLTVAPFSSLMFQDAAGHLRWWDMRRTTATSSRSWWSAMPRRASSRSTTSR